MNPEIASNIRKSAEGKVLIEYLAAVVISLDSIADIKLDDPIEATIELKARQRAADKLEEALSTLMADASRGTIPDVRDTFDV